MLDAIERERERAVASEVAKHAAAGVFLDRPPLCCTLAGTAAADAANERLSRTVFGAGPGNLPGGRWTVGPARVCAAGCGLHSPDGLLHARVSRCGSYLALRRAPWQGGADEFTRRSELTVRLWLPELCPDPDRARADLVAGLATWTWAARRQGARANETGLPSAVLMVVTSDCVIVASLGCAPGLDVVDVATGFSGQLAQAVLNPSARGSPPERPFDVVTFTTAGRRTVIPLCLPRARAGPHDLLMC